MFSEASVCSGGLPPGGLTLSVSDSGGGSAFSRAGAPMGDLPPGGLPPEGSASRGGSTHSLRY